MQVENHVFWMFVDVWPCLITNASHSPYPAVTWSLFLQHLIFSKDQQQQERQFNQWLSTWPPGCCFPGGWWRWFGSLPRVSLLAYCRQVDFDFEFVETSSISSLLPFNEASNWQRFGRWNEGSKALLRCAGRAPSTAELLWSSDHTDWGSWA